jgi:hypothetical protein
MYIKSTYRKQTKVNPRVGAIFPFDFCMIEIVFKAGAASRYGSTKLMQLFATLALQY